MEEKTYTLAEAQVEMAKQDCAREGHAPSRHFATMADNVGFHTCDCGAVTWVPRRKSEEPKTPQGARCRWCGVGHGSPHAADCKHFGLLVGDKVR